MPAPSDQLIGGAAQRRFMSNSIFNYRSNEPHVRDIVAGAGDRYRVRFPTENPTSSRPRGAVVKL